MSPGTSSLENLRTKGASSALTFTLIAGALCLLLFIIGLNDAVRNSAVADELGGHTAAGYLYWTSGKYTGGIANLPLGHLLIALPVVLLDRPYELFTEQHLVLFRLPVLLMGLLAGIVLYRLTAGLFGRTAAVATLFLFSLSPNILAHTSLATLDMPITFFVLLTMYALWCYLQRPHWTRMLALSLALACAMTTKIQGVLLLPLILFVLVVCAGSSRSRRKAATISHWSWIFLLLVPWVFINVIYLHLPIHSGGPLPPLFAQALKTKLFHAVGDAQPGYLLGEYSSEGWWYYFPFAILVKTPIPTLVLLVLGVIRRHGREVLLLVFLPAVVFLGVAMAASVNIGIRHVLIVYPFLFILAGRGAACLLSRSWRGAVLAVLAAGYLWQAAMIVPHHLSYFNTLAGGPRDGHRLLIDSNYDWGQNDHFLRRHVEERGITYKINPDPFRPTTGHILVNANALYGIYGSGGPAAYAWLRPFEPINRIAYTWFEYAVPADVRVDGEKITGHEHSVGPKTTFRPWNKKLDPQRRDAELEKIELYLHGLRHRYADVVDPSFRISLAWAFAWTAAYEDALDEVRRLLAQDPGLEEALGVGGELMVCWKLGILKFEGDQYLTGFRTRPVARDEDCPDVATVAESARVVEISNLLSRLHFDLGSALDSSDRIVEAVEQYRAALSFAPGNERARSRMP